MQDGLRGPVLEEKSAVPLCHSQKRSLSVRVQQIPTERQKAQSVALGSFTHIWLESGADLGMPWSKISKVHAAGRSASAVRILQSCSIIASSFSLVPCILQNCSQCVIIDDARGANRKSR